MIERRLEQTPGSHLLIVHYTPAHLVSREWVYNRADLEHARVIWARDLGRECDEKLIADFRGRRIWWIEPDTNPTELNPYSAPALTVAGQDPCLDDSGD